MVSSDLNVLLDMGFDPVRAEMAVKKTGGLQDALQWLEDNQDKSLEEISGPAPTPASKETDPSTEAPALKEGEVAKSMVCNECGRKFRSMAQVQFHAEKTEHVDFGESTEEIAPLTAEEKKQRLDELRANLAEKRARQAVLDKEEHKKNEKIRLKSTKEVQDIKEKLAQQEQIKIAAKKRQEKKDDIAAKKAIQEKIAADKEARRLKHEAELAARQGRAPPLDPSLAAAASASASHHPAGGPRKEATEARLRLQTANGVVIKTFPVDTTLFEVGQAIEADSGVPVVSFTMTYPKKTFEGSVDFGKTLKEAGLSPSAVLIVK